MTDFIGWLEQGGERLTVVMLLLIVLFVVVYGVQRKQRWWVPGWMLSDCEDERDHLKDRLQSYIQRTEDRLEDLEREQIRTHNAARSASGLRDSP